MPSYTYKCNNCGYIFELILPMAQNDTPTFEPCPQCHSATVLQIIVTPPQISESDILSIPKRLSGEWKDFMGRIAQKNPGSEIEKSKMF